MMNTYSGESTQLQGIHLPLFLSIKHLVRQLTNSATATTYVTGHDRSLTSKMTGWGVVMTGPDRSHASKMTGWGAVCDPLGGGL